MNLSFKSTYIVYLSTDGAGTHILRSHIINLSEKNLKVIVNHDRFWSKAYLALNEPKNELFNKNYNNIEFFLQLCKKEKIENLPAELNRDIIFDIFEKIYKKFDIILDFSREFSTSNYSSDFKWSQKQIDGVQDLVISYIHRKKDFINIKYISQVRNPLDHISSILERFGDSDKNFYSKENIRNRVLSNLLNIKYFSSKIKKINIDNIYLECKFEDFITKSKIMNNKISHLLNIDLVNNFYYSKISLNKWQVNRQIYKLLKDKKLMEISLYYNYNFSKFYKKIWLIILIKGLFLRNYYEIKLIIDTLYGKVNEINAINEKHKRYGIIPRILIKILETFGHEPTRRHIKNYQKKISKHSH